MLLPESWLRSIVNPDLSTDELAHRLTMSGLEVEDVRQVAEPFSGVVVAEVKSAEKHPDADKLKVCKVDAGSGEELQIVCGAPNVRAGVKFPLAKIGAKLPGDFKIKKSKLRGVESHGMLCSGRELGISQDHDGLLELDSAIQVGQDIREALDLDEAVFEIKLTPNRGDCLSALGVAREVRALTGSELKAFDFMPAAISTDITVPVSIQAPELCGRFVSRVITGVNAKTPTPAYIKQRLERAGQRSVSALVDISNYVMLELGRPSHMYDLDKIDGSINVRWAKSGEKLTLLNEQEVELDERCGVICVDDRPDCLAGVMGGLHTSVTDDTQNIFIECAFWYPEAIAGLTRKFKLNSEAAHRFERGVDYLHIEQHIEYMTRLVLEICGGQAGPVEDQSLNLPERAAVQMRLDRCQKIIGVPVTEEDVNKIFTQLGFEYSMADGIFSVTPPSYRFDLTIEEDLIEEVARIYGYDQIPERTPVAALNLTPQAENLNGEHVLRDIMVDLDYQEVVNYSFIEKELEHSLHGNANPIKLLNPIASTLSVMRSSLISGLLRNIEFNARRKQPRVRCFELGKVFARAESAPATEMSVKGVNQEVRLAGAAWGPAEPEQWGVPNRKVDFFDVKNDLLALCSKNNHKLQFVACEHPALHPGRAASILLDGEQVGVIGELHPAWLSLFSLDSPAVVFEIKLDAISEVPLHLYEQFSSQPVVLRDLALWLPNNIQYQDLVAEIKKHPDLSLIKDVRLFDIWKDPKTDVAERSLAMRFSLQDAEATLNDEQVDEVMNKVVALLSDKFSARPR